MVKALKFKVNIKSGISRNGTNVFLHYSFTIPSSYEASN